MKNKNTIILFLGSALLAAYPCVLYAQEAEQRRSTMELEEIIVTTERREQSLQDVPLSVTAFGAEVRDRVGILSIQTMADFSPGVSYNTSNDSPSIRGIGRQSNIFSLDSPVANYFDGVYTSSVQDAQRRPIFVERTEILRGPQGALSGRGSIAGAVNTYSKRPTETFEGEVRGFTENYSRYGSEVTVAGPITDWLRTRINLGAYRQDDGYFTNVANREKEGDQPNNRENADYLFEVDLGESVDLFLKFSFADYDESRRSVATDVPAVGANDYVDLAATAYGAFGSPLTPNAYYGYSDPGATQVGDVTENPVTLFDNKRYYNNNFRSRQRLKDHHNYTAHLTWDTDLFEVKWIGGHQNYDYTQWTDGDGTAVTSMTIFGFDGVGFVPRVVDPSAVNQYMEQREWFSNEITLSSVSGGPVQWIAGVYQSNEDYVQQPFTLTHAGYNELATPGGAPINQHGNASVFGEVEGETISSAVFGQVDWQVLDQLKFTLGLRYNKDEKEATEQTRYVANNVGFGLFLAGIGSSTDVTPAPNGIIPRGVVADHGIDPVSGNRVRDLEGDWSATAGTFGIDYTPGDDHLIYFRAASGYRPGGFNAGFIASTPQVDEENVLSYEVGYKATIAEKLRLSTSAFYYDFQDQQLELPTLGRCTDPSDVNTCTVVENFFNIPETVNQGFEVELTWFATDNLSFLLTYGFLDTEIKDGLVNGEGFQNPEDPGAVLPNANRYSLFAPDPLDPTNPALAAIDAGYTNLPRYNQDLSGNELKDAPKHKVAFNTSYVIGFDAGDLTLSANYIWRDEHYSDVFESEPGIVDGYNMVDVRGIWTDASDTYSVIVYGSNIFNEEAAVSGGFSRRATSASGADGQVFYKSYNLAPPRSYGLELQYRFGG